RILMLDEILKKDKLLFSDKKSLNLGVNYRRVNNYCVDVMFNEESHEVKVVNRSRFHTYNRGGLGSRSIYSVKEALEAIKGLGKRALKDIISFRIFDTHSKRIFRYIYANIKLVIHPKNTSNVLVSEAGYAPQPFLHIYTGSKSQPTYSGSESRKQTPLRASMAQVPSTFSCFFNFYIQFYQIIVRTRQKVLKKS
ncbi:MAG: hypothetical protein ACP5QM_07185, partial [Caldisericum sp.]|uniref:hypothetical protein n=1 Tax=Caldisericum sp. TaxID=2499687 RepID=UPI003D112D5E